MRDTEGLAVILQGYLDSGSPGLPQKMGVKTVVVVAVVSCIVVHLYILFYFCFIKSVQ